MASTIPQNPTKSTFPSSLASPHHCIGGVQYPSSHKDSPHMFNKTFSPSHTFCLAIPFQSSSRRDLQQPYCRLR